MDRNGVIYIGEHESGVMHHSSFLSGASVISAGMIKVEKGKIVDINHHSGHYLPKKENLENFLLRMDIKVFADKSQIKFYSGHRSQIIQEFANLLIGIQTNPNYSWLPASMLIQLTRLGRYINSVNERHEEYEASFYYKKDEGRSDDVEDKKIAPGMRK